MTAWVQSGALSGFFGSPPKRESAAVRHPRPRRTTGIGGQARPDPGTERHGLFTGDAVDGMLFAIRVLPAAVFGAVHHGAGPASAQARYCASVVSVLAKRTPAGLEATQSMLGGGPAAGSRRSGKPRSSAVCTHRCGRSQVGFARSSTAPRISPPLSRIGLGDVREVERQATAGWGLHKLRSRRDGKAQGPRLCQQTVALITPRRPGACPMGPLPGFVVGRVTPPSTIDCSVAASMASMRRAGSAEIPGPVCTGANRTQLARSAQRLFPTRPPGSATVCTATGDASGTTLGATCGCSGGFPPRDSPKTAEGSAESSAPSQGSELPYLVARDSFSTPYTLRSPGGRRRVFAASVGTHHARGPK